MILRSIVLTFILLFTACGGNSNIDTDTKTLLSTLEQNSTILVQDQNITDKNISTPVPIVKPSRTVTIYIHGYSKDGYNRNGVYGDINQDTVVDNLAYMTNLPTMENFDENSTHILAVATYYGDQAPAYYTQKDLDDIDAVTKTYGGGIPRYAAIIAKFAKHVMEETKADKLNIVSASMGSLVTRWLIEKDLENLASQKKIKKWLSIEGVIRGNYAASNDILMDMIDPIMKQHIDTKHMDYDWINSNLDGISAVNPNYKDIKMGFISSTHDKDGALDTFLSINGQLQPNDGVQLLKDTYFAETPNHTPSYTHYYQDHIGIKNDKGAWAQAATFLTSKRKVKITLLDAEISDLHEHINKYFNKRAEIVFQSEVYSPKIYETFGVDDAISERIVAGGALNLIKYKHKNETKEVNQLIFNDYVLNDENNLRVKITGYELDKVLIYGVREISINSSKANLGTVELNIPLENKTFKVSGKDWSGTIKVEIL
jgi:hypothetical protein